MREEQDAISAHKRVLILQFLKNAVAVVYCLAGFTFLATDVGLSFLDSMIRSSCLVGDSLEMNPKCERVREWVMLLDESEGSTRTTVLLSCWRHRSKR